MEREGTTLIFSVPCCDGVRTRLASDEARTRAVTRGLVVYRHLVRRRGDLLEQGVVLLHGDAANELGMLVAGVIEPPWADTFRPDFGLTGVGVSVSLPGRVARGLGDPGGGRPLVTTGGPLWVHDEGGMVVRVLLCGEQERRATVKHWFLRSGVVALAVASLIVPASRALAGPGAPQAPASGTRALTTGRAQIVAGAYAGYAIKPDGSLWAWGLNNEGQLALGDTKNRRLPTHVGRSFGWAMIAAGWSHCLAVKLDGSLWAWGGNDVGELGIGINGRYGNRPRVRPQRVTGGGWKAVAAGDGSSFGLKRDGSLWAWGGNNLGVLGLGTTTTRLGAYAVPTRVGTGNNWQAIAVGDGWVLALKRDGSLWSWGDNSLGCLGQGTSDDLAHPTPTRVGSDTDWTAISAGGVVSLALKRDGSLWSWGANAEGQLGLGDTVSRSVPTRVGTGTAWKAIAAAQEGGLALKRDGSLWSWGENFSGELGIGHTHGNRKSPTRVEGSGWAKITAGNSFSLALKANGTYWAWGNDHVGQLGLAVLGQRVVPRRIVSLR